MWKFGTVFDQLGTTQPSASQFYALERFFEPDKYHIINYIESVHSIHLRYAELIFIDVVKISGVSLKVDFLILVISKVYWEFLFAYMPNFF